MDTLIDIVCKKKNQQLEICKELIDLGLDHFMLAISLCLSGKNYFFSGQ